MIVYVLQLDDSVGCLALSQLLGSKPLEITAAQFSDAIKFHLEHLTKHGRKKFRAVLESRILNNSLILITGLSIKKACQVKKLFEDLDIKIRATAMSDQLKLDCDLRLALTPDRQAALAVGGKAALKFIAGDAVYTASKDDLTPRRLAFLKSHIINLDKFAPVEWFMITYPPCHSTAPSNILLPVAGL